MIRRSRAADLPALRQICVSTGNLGADASGLFSDDGLLPDVYLEPYLLLEPRIAWTLEVDGLPAGYLVGTLDTAGFVEWWRREWVPVFESRYEVPDARPAVGSGAAGAAVSAEERMVLERGRDPAWMLGEQVAKHPAHLHIDLLPAARGRGFGRDLMRVFARAVTAGGGSGIHLGVAMENTGARAFYGRSGFRPLGGDPTLLGIEAAELF